MPKRVIQRSQEEQQQQSGPSGREAERC
jgi:hypothetical protein